MKYRSPLLFLPAAWAGAVLLFAGQWWLYDSAHGAAEPFRYYAGWSAYIWGVLTPLAVCLAYRWPLDGRAWKRNLPRHLAASVLLTAVELSAEASFGWWRHGDLAFEEALRHYFAQHTQMCLLAYWVLVGGVGVRAVYDESRTRALRSSQLEARLAQVRLQALRGQLQPHFLFNTLQAAVTLIYDDPEGAEEILLSLSELLRLCLEAFEQPEVPLAQEVRFLQHYVAIQQRRFGDRLRCDIEIGEDLGNLAVPGLLLQPLVENAIRHGIGKHEGDDRVSVRAHRDGDRLHLEVRNRNSVLEDSPERLSSPGVGLANTRTRLEQLYGRLHSFELRKLEPAGAEVALSFPARQLGPGTA